jgi:hypothetical protein
MSGQDENKIKVEPVRNNPEGILTLMEAQIFLLQIPLRKIKKKESKA